MANKFEKLTQHEHILKRPDSYIGSNELKEFESVLLKKDRFENKVFKEYNDGLYKIFDEIIVNSTDQHIRLLSTKDEVKKIHVTIDQDTGEISVMNDGKGIDIIKLPEYNNTYAPSMIFGELLTSTNYNDDDLKVVGGKNGFGAKLTNIYSKKFVVETVGKNEKGKKMIFKQVFTDNMYKIGKPSVKTTTSKEYTKITFLPDYERFHMKKGISKDMFEIFRNRIYQVSAIFPDLDVRFNEDKIKINNFQDYFRMFGYNNVISTAVDKPTAKSRVKMPRWTISVSTSDNFEQVSFVNGINTVNGGKHVDHIRSLISKKVTEYIKEKKKINVNANIVKDNIAIGLSCFIDNPSFDSQSKKTLTTTPSKFYTNFNKTFEIPENFYKAILKSDFGLIEKVLKIYEFKENLKNDKKTDGKKTSRLFGIPKLEDANLAGGSKSHECTLILTEGDSAKSMAVAGFSVVGRDRFGVFPLRGKLLNTRDISKTLKGKDKISKNEELISIKKILGLESNKKYNRENIKDLRYGSVMIMTDQDLDGSHIKGLIMNYFATDCHWKELLEIGYIKCFQTPIIKASKGKIEKVFYNLKEYEDFKNNSSDISKFKIKYYKGLGTSTTNEAKEYFKNMNIIDYNWTKDSSNVLDMAFNKDRSDERKNWLKNYDKNSVVTKNVITYEEFINKELIHFSNYDTYRSIPSVVDGFKPSQRKILFSCLKRNLKNEIRVAQLAGYVSEHAGYHHGEASLNAAIISMAQTFVGSNNLTFLQESGQFGTRISNGKDAGSPRYLHTALTKLTEKMFITSDNDNLKFLDDDGLRIEPEFYVPILPMILINGANGIGTGYSTKIPMHNTKECFNYIKGYLQGKKNKFEAKPYYNGFTGKIEKITSNSYITRGAFTIKNLTTLNVSELPIGTSTDTFKEMIDNMIVEKSKVISNYVNNSTESTVNIDIKFSSATVLKDLLKKAKAETGTINCIEKLLKLTSKISLTNMHAFDSNGIIKKYANIDKIMQDFIKVRMEFYDLRKKSEMKSYQEKLKILENKIRFISMVTSGLKIHKLKKNELINLLDKEKFMKVNGCFDYLINIAIYRFTSDEINKLESDHETNKSNLDVLKKTSLEELWLNDLKDIEKYI